MHTSTLYTSSHNHTLLPHTAHTYTNTAHMYVPTTHVPKHTHTHLYLPTHTHPLTHTLQEPQSSHALTTYTHSVGRGVLHRGQHMHGAHSITSGVRYNLIVWMRASSVRNKLCPMCDTPPQLVVTEGPGDGFTSRTPSGSCDIS